MGCRVDPERNGISHRQFPDGKNRFGTGGELKAMNGGRPINGADQYLGEL
jgi:hypothetical protein